MTAALIGHAFLQLPANPGHWAFLPPDASALLDVLFSRQGMGTVHADAAPRRESGGGIEAILLRP